MMVKLPPTPMPQFTAAPVMSPPLAAMVKSTGSISQVPLCPSTGQYRRWVLGGDPGVVGNMYMRGGGFDEAAVTAIGCPASSVPPTLTVPASMPPSRVIVPSWLSTVRASITPVLLTTLASRRIFGSGGHDTPCPPSAWISPPFSARLFNTLWSTCRWTRLLPLKVSVTALPAPSATVPSWAVMVPWLLTCCRATRRSRRRLR